MKTDDYTRGPWQWRTYPDGCVLIGTRPHIPGSMVLQRLKDVTVETPLAVDDDQANAKFLSADAKLIAAAPELFEALRGILEIGKRDMSNPKYDGYFEEAKKALAKAQGGRS